MTNAPASCEYEAGAANLVRVEFPNREAGKRFQRVAKAKDLIEALRKRGYGAEAKRVILNQITMALTSDFLHHVFEGLICLEKRKFIVAFNVLRKPLKDNLPSSAGCLPIPTTSTKPS